MYATLLFSIWCFEASSGTLDIPALANRVDPEFQVAIRDDSLRQVKVQYALPSGASVPMPEPADVLRILGVSLSVQTEQVVIAESLEQKTRTRSLRMEAVRSAVTRATALPNNAEFGDVSYWRERARQNYIAWQSGGRAGLGSPQSESVLDSYLQLFLASSLSQSPVDYLPGSWKSYGSSDLSLPRFSLTDKMVRETLENVGMGYRSFPQSESAWRVIADRTLLASGAERFVAAIFIGENTVNATGFFLDQSGRSIATVSKVIPIKIIGKRDLTFKASDTPLQPLAPAVRLWSAAQASKGIGVVPRVQGQPNPNAVPAFLQGFCQLAADDLRLPVFLALSDEQTLQLARLTTLPFSIKQVLGELQNSYGVTVERFEDALMIRGGSYEFLNRVSSSSISQSLTHRAGQAQDLESILRSARAMGQGDLASPVLPAVFKLGSSDAATSSVSLDNKFPSPLFACIMRTQRTTVQLPSRDPSLDLYAKIRVAQLVSSGRITGSDTIPCLRLILGHSSGDRPIRLSVEESQEFRLRFKSLPAGPIFWSQSLPDQSVMLAKAAGLMPTVWVKQQQFDLYKHPAKVMELVAGDASLLLDSLRYGQAEFKSGVKFVDLPEAVQASTLEVLTRWEAEWAKEQVPL